VLGGANDATVNLNSGVLQARVLCIGGTKYDSHAACAKNGILNINGGVAEISTLYFGALNSKAGTSDGGGYASATLNLTGGKLEVSKFSFNAYHSQYFTWGSGTIKATATNVFTRSAIVSGAGSRTVSVNGTPAVFDTGDFAQNLPVDIASGTGTGTLKLTGGNNVTLPAGSTPAFGILLDGDTTLTVNGSGTSIPSLTLMDGSTLNITNHNGNTPLTVTTLTFPESGKVNLSMEGEAFPPGVYAIYSADGVTETDGEKFTVKDTFDYSWSVEDDTLILSVIGVATATWTGAANDGVYSNPANWTCYDNGGNEVPGAVPGPAAAITLGTDVSDGWSSFDAVAQVGAIDLNGHNLAVSCSGTLAFSVTNSSDATSSELRITVPQDATFNKTADFGIAGNISLVKDGPGTLLWSHAGASALAASIPVLVTNGVFKLGATAENLFGTSGTVTVKDPGQFDINYIGTIGPVRARTFYIEGDGPNGSGVIVNSAANNTSGRIFNKIVLTGDATIGGSGYIDIRDDGNGIDCGGYELTVKNTGRLLVFTDTYMTNATDIVVAGGRLWVCNSCELGAERIVLEKGSTFYSYMSNNGTQKFNIPFVVREGSGEIRAEGSSYYHIYDTVTVESGCTLNLQTVAPWYDAFDVKTGATMNISGDTCMKTGAGGLITNAGTIDHTAGLFCLGYRDGTGACTVENDGLIKTSGGTFRFKAESSMTGAGTLELAGGSPQVLGTISDFTGTILLSGGTTTVSRVSTFTGTLRLKGGALSSGTSLAGFAGTAVIDIAARATALNVDGKNWFTFDSGTEVLVDVGSRELLYGDTLLSWETAPSNVRFKLQGEHKGMLRKGNDGLVYAKNPGLIVLVQ